MYITLYSTTYYFDENVSLPIKRSRAVSQIEFLKLTIRPRTFRSQRTEGRKVPFMRERFVVVNV